MTEVTTQVEARELPLHGLHVRQGATLTNESGWWTPAVYQNWENEYWAVRRDGAGVFDLSSRSRILISGSEAVQFLNGLITNDVKTLAQGSWMHAAFPNVQGRLLGMVRVLHTSSGFLLDMESSVHDAVFNSVSKFTLAGDFKVADLTDAIATISLQGPHAAEIIAKVLNDSTLVERGRIVELNLKGSSISLIRATHTAEDGFDLFVEVTGAEEVWEALVSAGARPAGTRALEVLRIEAGIPRHGIDISESNVVLESGLDDAVSFTKGCYLGQEIIARTHWRGHVAKRLTGLVLEENKEVAVDDSVTDANGKEIGRVSSTSFSPLLSRPVALAMIKFDYLKPGTDVHLGSTSEKHEAKVAALPMVPGSWRDESDSSAK